MFTLSQIIEKLGGEFRGDNISVHAIAPASRAQANEITFLANPKYKHEVENSTAGAVIVSQKAADLFPNRNVIVVPDPYLYFAKVARLFHPIVAPKAGVHPTAVIEPTAVVPASCEIGANVYIGANTVLGERCRILANAVIEHDCTLGNDCFIHPNVTVYFGCTIGHRVELHSGCVIGADGFGLAFSGSDWFKIPQTGGVTLGDDVEIGSNTNIGRGAMSDAWLAWHKNRQPSANRAQLQSGRTHRYRGANRHFRQHDHRQLLRDWRRCWHGWAYRNRR